MNNIEKFISRFSDCNWLNGNCYYFAVILKDRFNGEIIYDPIQGHFLMKLIDKCYDFSGCHELPKTFYYWDELEEKDEMHYLRIKRDCVD